VCGSADSDSVKKQRFSQNSGDLYERERFPQACRCCVQKRIYRALAAKPRAVLAFGGFGAGGGENSSFAAAWDPNANGVSTPRIV